MSLTILFLDWCNSIGWRLTIDSVELKIRAPPLRSAREARQILEALHGSIRNDPFSHVYLLVKARQRDMIARAHGVLGLGSGDNGLARLFFFIFVFCML